MKLTCLGGGGRDESLSPTSFLLEVCRTKLLLESPIDLSSLLLFLPTILPSKEHNPGPVDVNKIAGGSKLPSSSSLGLGSGTDSLYTHSGKRDLRGNVSSGEYKEALVPAIKLPKVGLKRTSTHESTSQNGGDKSHDYRMGSSGLLDAAPWYRTPDFQLLVVSLLDAVIISNPVAMLGLPFLFRNTEFSAKIYATDATAKLGQLMMEELVSLHAEFVQLYGRTKRPEIPPWLECILPSELNEQISGSSAGEEWHRLYSTADIKACIAKIHRLRYGEEVNINGSVRIKPSSSGFGIGSCNWIIKGTDRNVTYISTSVLNPNHSMPLDFPALGGCEVLLFSCGKAPEFLEVDSAEVRKAEAVSVAENKSVDLKAVQTMSNELHQGIEGVVQKQSSQRLSASPSSSVSPAPIGSTPGNSGAIHKHLSNVLVPVPSDKSIKSSCEEQEAPKQSNFQNVDKRIRAISKAGVEAVGGGGSVLIPLSLYGSFLEILEDLSTQLRSAGLEQVPIFYISPVAEELLAYANTVPEWLSSARQEKLYAGEPLFGFVEAIREKRLHHFPALHTPDLLRCWQEPCVVFATHWTLRVGSAVQLLHRWRNNPLCLLILTEPNIDPKLLLAPFEPCTIQVLHQPVLANLKSDEVASIIRKLKPRLTLVPETLKDLGSSQGPAGSPLGEVSCYKLRHPYKIPRFQNDMEVEMSADLALQIQLKQIKSGKVAAARLNADLHLKDGRWSLEMPSPSSYCGGSLRSMPRHQIRWGKVDVDSLLTAFRERQMYDIYVTERTVQEDNNLAEKVDSKEVIIEITSPSSAKIEITSAKINVHANEPGLRRLIVEVLNSALNVL